MRENYDYVACYVVLLECYVGIVGRRNEYETKQDNNGIWLSHSSDQYYVANAQGPNNQYSPIYGMMLSGHQT